ncbi:hypothetical protein [uncultured Pseudodesulfovibrio sp.]|uniref:hypothetical protein n=1 Tax=uncultured Pseudodesulfovibrio sp. TaxID=2035858 RepID=UPI0029C846C4|nr:hypothetical protein [uncultured Pseudodesulfovibrio sp.]
MSRKRLRFQQVFRPLGIAVMIVGVMAGLVFVNERMTVRYQAVGRVVDANLRPLGGVAVVLLLTPPPVGDALDRLLESETEGNGLREPTGSIRHDAGPVIGVSSENGAFVVRVSGRQGAAHAIRMGLDSGGRPPFEQAWLVLRKKGYPDMTRVISILGWQPVPRGWGTHADTLPVVIMNRGGSP